MTRNHIIIRPAGSSVYKRQHLVNSSPSTGSSRGRIAEAAGGTTAECAAILCCCPCSLVNLLVLAMYKLPAGICRKALRQRKRRRMIKKGLLPLPSSSSSSSSSVPYGKCQCGMDQGELEFGLAQECPQEVTVVLVGGNEMDKDLMELEKEMWAMFYSTGFWRSSSQRSQP